MNQTIRAPNQAMHSDLLQRAGSMKGGLVAASQTGDGGRWVAFRFSKCFFRGFRKTAVFENQRGWLRDGNPRRAGTTAALRSAQSGKPDAVAQMGRLMVCATQQWHAPDSTSTVHRSESRLRGVVLAGDACR